MPNAVRKRTALAWLPSLLLPGFFLGCGADDQTGLWIRVVTDAAKPAAIDRVLIGVYDADGPGESPVQQQDLSRPPPGGQDFWVLVLAGPEFQTRAIRVVGRGFRGSREISAGSLPRVEFTRGQIVDAPGFLTLSPYGRDDDQDGFFVPEDCDDTDPSIHPEAVEFCDDLDNNCDGTIDEGCPCSPGLTRECWPQWASEPAPGSPCRKGTQRCGATGWGACEGIVLPSPEECPDGALDCFACLDGVDNDCDGFMDRLDTGCGGCQVGTWAWCYDGPDGTWENSPCSPGQRLCETGDPTVGPCQGQKLPEDEVCNGYDDDCDGLTDNPHEGRPVQTGDCALFHGVCAGAQMRCELGQTVPCTPADYEANARARLCQGPNQPACCAGSGLDCHAAQETLALCDGEDNDCDGTPDNAVDGLCQCEVNQTLPCPTTPTGNRSEGECREGLWVCRDGAWEMNPDCRPPSQELCDNLDNNCDGVTDMSVDSTADCARALAAAGKVESYHAALTGCSLGVCRFTCQPGWVDLQAGQPSHPHHADQPPNGLPGSDGCEYACTRTIPFTERCDGLDNDCNGFTDAEDLGVSLAILCPDRDHATVTACRPATGCDYTCLAPYADCNGNLHDPVPLELANETSDGCEINLHTDVRHCGTCGFACGPHARCNQGQCECDPGWADCQNGWSDGCETQLGTLSDCRSCGEICNDGIECTEDRCHTTQGCQFPFYPAGTACGSQVETVCDLRDTCDGQGACLPNYAPASRVCRDAAGPCDVEEYCPGTGPNCPGDSFRLSSHECRASAGVCDLPEFCTGSSAACPNNTFRPNSYECRASAGVCDLAENCTGSTAACPTDAFRSNSYVCRASAGACDLAENCSGSSATCPTDAFRPNTYECRASAGACDLAENCPGNGVNCPTDSFRPNTFTCRASAGACDLAENCTGNAAACPTDVFRPNTFECRASDGVCDLAENCSGSSATCPTNAFRPNTFECRASAGVCDLAENCSGSSATCPTNAFRPNTYECRASAGACDLAENCPGNGVNCPTDSFRPNTFTCRASAGACDLAENCPGNAAACPTDAFRPSTYECRASDGVCDLAETCTGSSAACPTDAFRPNTYECRASTHAICDPAETCTGGSASCPADAWAPNDTDCGSSCAGPNYTKRVCLSGSCNQSAAVSCNDGVTCTTDSCVEPAGCVNTDNCSDPHASCNTSLDTCECDPGWDDCDTNGSCECDLSTGHCESTTCVSNG
jgi:hypothetical protein